MLEMLGISKTYLLLFGFSAKIPSSFLNIPRMIENNTELKFSCVHSIVRIATFLSASFCCPFFKIINLSEKLNLSEKKIHSHNI